MEGQVQSLLNAARNSGLNLSGSGYRDPSRQVEVRRQNCGSSHYAIYEMSSSACRPPTAVPGSSQHEVGLAIDFTNCATRSTACYQWLNANAANHGLYNLPSEPWHWSTTGR
jgi:LAS superfamily LD-carboxypeptidase LdcB